MELMELIATVGAALIQPVIAVAVVLIIISSTKNKNAQAAANPSAQPTQIGPITPVIQPKKANPNSGLNILTFLGGALLVIATMMFVNQTDGAAVPPTIITLTLLTFAAGAILYKKTPFLKPVAVTFTVVSLLIFPFLYYAYSNMGLDDHTSGVLSTISTFIAFTVSSYLMKNRVLPYFAYAWLAAIIFSLVPEEMGSERAYIYLLTPMILAFPPMIAWTTKAKWLPIHWRHAARTYAYATMPILAYTFICGLAAISTGDWGGTPAFLLTIMAAIGTCFYGLWWKFSGNHRCVMVLRVCVQLFALALVYECIQNFTNFGNSYNYYYRTTSTEHVTQMLTFYVATVFSFVAQYAFGLIIRAKDKFERGFENTLTVVAMLGILASCAVFESGNDRVSCVLGLTSSLLVGAMGIIQAVRAKNSIWAIASCVSLIVMPIALEVGGLTISETAYCIYYSIVSVAIAASYAVLRKFGRIPALITTVISVTLTCLFVIGLAIDIEIPFIGWLIVTLSLGIIALVDNNKILLEASAYLATITVAAIVGYVFENLTILEPVKEINGESAYRYMERENMADYIATIINLHVISYGLMLVGLWLERGKRFKVRFALGYYFFSFAMLIAALAGVAEYNWVIPAALFLVQQAIFIVLSVIRRYEWLTWSALVAIIFDIFILMADYGWLSLAAVGLVLIFVAAWKMTQNHNKGLNAPDAKLEPKTEAQKPIEPIEKPKKAPVEKPDEEAKIISMEAEKPESVEKADIIVEESSIEIEK